MQINWKKINKIDQNKFFVNTPTQKIFLSKIKQRLVHKKTIPFICNYLYIGSIFFMFNNSKFYQAITSSDSVHLDGFAIGKITKILYQRQYEDFTPKDFLSKLLSFCEINQLKVFLLGSYPGEKGIEKALEKVSKEFPKLNIEGNNGFFKNNSELIKKINNFKPELLVVGLGLKKQEEWIQENKAQLNTNVIVSVGNYIDILAGRVKAPAAIYKKLHLRWLRRLVKEPKRLWKRYLGGIFYLTLIFISHYTHKSSA